MLATADPEYALSSSEVDEHAINHGVDFVRSLLPAILDAGIATEEEVEWGLPAG